MSGQVKSIQPAIVPQQTAPQPTVQEPVSGATIQLYQVGTAGDGSSATALGSSTTTGPSGGFTLTGDYTCPVSNPLVYLLATGGNPGLAPTTNNTAIVLIAALGPCNSLTPTTSINLSEVTTVAAVAALSPYMTSPSCKTAPTCIGSSTSDADGLTAAFTLASQYANTATGTSPGTSVPAGDTIPSTLINTLAGIISSCVNTTGGAAGDGSNCGMLFTDSTPSGGAAPTDVVTALLNISSNPTSDLTQLFGLLPTTPSTPPFEPVLSAAPSSWAVNPSGYTVSGQVQLPNYCSSSPTYPTFTVSLGSPSETTQTDSNGNFAIPNVPNGTYSISASLYNPPAGANALFYYATPITGFQVNNSNYTGIGIQAQVTYTVSGTVSYSGTQTGQTYLYLQNNNCGGSGNPGTSITEATLTGSGAYSIRGVNPGNYTLYAWMDSTGITSGTDYPGPQGVANFNNPAGNTSSFNVTSANVTQNVTLTNPTYAAPPRNPQISILPHEGGVMISYSPPSVNASNGNKEEEANEYTVNWAVSDTTDSDGPICSIGGGTDGNQFKNVAGSHTFYATGKGTDLWILNNTSMGSGSFTAGGTYCFQARAFNTLYTSGTNHPTGAWATQSDGDGNSQGIALPTTTVFCTSSCTTVSGAITIPSNITCSSSPSQPICSGAPLYVGIYQQSPGSNGPTAIYSYEIPNPVSGGAGNSYSMTIPNGSGYILFGILDQNNDGVIDAYDVTNTRESGNSSGLTFPGSPSTQDLTLPGTNSTVEVQTEYQSYTCSGCGSVSTGYSLNFQINEANKLLVSVTLSQAPGYVITPVDMSLCGSCGNEKFEYSPSLLGGTPSVGDSFDFTVYYSDGSEDSGTTVNGAVTAFGSTGAVVGPSDLPTNLSPSVTASSDTPTFTWTDPNLSNPGSYLYSFYLSGNNCNGDCTIWQIPGNNSNSDGFSNAITSITWGTDPTGGGSTPSVSSLTGGDIYNWQIQVQDSNGNQAQSSVYFGTSAGPLTLPAANPASLPAAVLSVPYNGTITASGGYPPYQYLVTGSSTYGANPVTLTNGLQVTDAHDNTLVVGGTPTSNGTVTFQATVKDSTGTTYGPVTYTVHVNSQTAVSLPAANTNPLGPGLSGTAYGAYINASGGAGGTNYSFVVNGTAIPTNGTATTASGSDGLTFSNSGGNNLTVGGTPTTAEMVSLTIEVIDTVNSSNDTVTYSLNVTTGPDGSHDSYLSGTYVCKFDGFDDSDNSRGAVLLSIVANGSGSLNSGVFDENDRDLSAPLRGTVSGTYKIGADNNGLLTTTTVVTSGGSGSNTTQFAVALNNLAGPTASEFRLVESDDVGSNASGEHGSAVCYQAATSAFALSTFNGGFVFSQNGEDSGGIPEAGLDLLSASNGTVNSGYRDKVKVGSADSNLTFTGGSFTTPNATTGRSTLTITSSAGTVTYAVYLIDANRGFVLDISENSAQSGDLRKQQQSSYSAANLDGPFVLYSQGFDYSGTSVTSYYSWIAQGSGDGVGNATFNQSYNDGGGTYVVGFEKGGPNAVTFDSLNPGRATMNPGGGTTMIYMYFYDNNSALEMLLNPKTGTGNTDAGWIEAQTQSTFTDAAVAGNYSLGLLPLLEPPPSGTAGEFDLLSNGNLTAGVTNAGEGKFTYDQSASGTYSWDTTATGTGSFLTGGGLSGLSCIVISSTKDACISNTSPDPGVTILQQ